eukprot:TRINITY_DN28227_c0_g1_i1.p1 TRINITY_DN28227_c0_g1~~TRINITY_DN28227_c0_g1_i1.p1  ORF type:complete len:934 (+),score=271.42 TRINITY_DN28227_c0_g1_i1:51-2852(+)
MAASMIGGPGTTRRRRGQTRASRPTSVGDAGSVDMNSEGFDPRLYINTELKGLSFDMLRDEHTQLQRRREEDEQEMRDLVASHLDTFIKCRDAISLLLTSEESEDLFGSRPGAASPPPPREPGGPLRARGSTVTDLRRAQKELLERCTQVFEPLLDAEQRLTDVDGVRQVLDKHRTIFTMPETIQGHIAKGEYDAVIQSQAYMHSQRAGLTPEGEGGQGAELLRSVFRKVDEQLAELRRSLLNELRATPVVERQRAESLLRVLQRLRCPRLLQEFCRAASSGLRHALDLAARNFAAALRSQLAQLDRQEEHWTAAADGLHSAQWSTEMATQPSVDTAAQSWLGSPLRRHSGSGAASMSFNPFTSGATTGMPQLGYEACVEMVSARCGLPAAQQLLARFGSELAQMTLAPFWQTFTRVWRDDDVDASEDEDVLIPAVVQLFEEAVTAYRQLVWPLVLRFAPERSAATPQQWRTALLSVVRPLQGLLDLVPDGRPLVPVESLKDELQSHFFTESCQRLSAEIAGWAAGMRWSVGLHLCHRNYISTALPARFEEALRNLLDLWAQRDELCPDHTQQSVIQKHFFEAHLTFLDLLHHLAFEADPPGAADDTLSEGERALALLADAIAFRDLVVHQTYTAFRAWLADEVLATPAPEERYSHERRLSAAVLAESVRSGADVDGAAGARGSSAASPRHSALASWRASVRRLSLRGKIGTGFGGGTERDRAKAVAGSDAAADHVKILRRCADILKGRLVRRVVECELRSIVHTVCVEGFLRTDVDWHYAAEPRGVREYLHTLLLQLVALHEATVRLTGGNATTEVLRMVFDEVVVLMHHSVRQLNFTALVAAQETHGIAAIANATLQVEVEARFLEKAVGKYAGQRGLDEMRMLHDHLQQVVQRHLSNQAGERRRNVMLRVLKKSLEANRALVSSLSGADI